MTSPSAKYTIPVRGLSVGRHRFGMELSDALMRSFDCTEVKDVAVTASLEVERTAARVVVEASLKGQVTVECDRCLEDLTLPVDYSATLEIRFISEHSAVQEPGYDGEVMWIAPGEAQADLAAFLYESVILALPYRRVHPEGECDPAMRGRFEAAGQNEM